MNSPLGKYAQLVAAVVAIGTIGAYIALVVVGTLLGIDVEDATSTLKDFALIALGAVFGSFATVNGVKGPVESAHSRIDKIETATGIPTHGAYPDPSASPPPSS